MNAPGPDAKAQTAEARREFALHLLVYSDWARRGTLTQAKADRQLALMEAVLKATQETRR